MRGTGVFWAIELVRTGRRNNQSSRRRWPSSNGICWPAASSPFVVDNRIHVVPPAVITPAEARHGLRLIDDALSLLGDLIMGGGGGGGGKKKKKRMCMAPDGENRRVQTKRYGQPIGDPVPPGSRDLARMR